MPKNKAAVMLGKRGGKASAKSLTPEQRRVRAKKAVDARIKKYKQNGKAKNAA